MSPAAAAWRVAAAAAGVVATVLPGGPWWASLLGGAALWPVLLRCRPAAAALAAALAFAPLPALAFSGLVAAAPLVWVAATLGVAGAYAATGAFAAHALRRATAAQRIATWGWSWLGVDLALAHAPVAWPLPPLAPGSLLAEAPLAAWAALGGPAALTPVWVAVTAALAAASGGFAPARSPAPRPAARAFARALPRAFARALPRAFAWGGLAAAAFVGAAAIAHAAGRVPTGEPRAVVVARGVADDDRVAATRTDPATFDAIAAELAATAAAHDAGAHLHVWPEAALGYVVGDAPRRLAAAAAALAAPLLAGGYRPDGDGGWRNAALFVERGQATWAYDKERLVPRFESWLRPGVGERWSLRAAGLRWGVLVCWESLFADLGAARVRAGAGALVVLAHDGWAVRGAAPDTHARLARALAWAVGRPVVFAAHDGPARAWGHAGAALVPTELGGGATRFDVAAPRAWTTPFVRWGAALPLAGWVAWPLARALAAVARVARVPTRPARPGAAAADAAARADQGRGAPGPHAA